MSPSDELRCRKAACPARMMLSLSAPQVMPLLLPEPIMLTPSCFMTMRLTSATVTFSVTWSSPMIFSRLTIWLTAGAS